MMIHDGLGITIGDLRHRIGCLGRFPVAPGIIQQVLGVSWWLWEWLCWLWGWLWRLWWWLWMDFHGFPWFSLDFHGFLGGGGGHRTGVVGGDRRGLGALIQYPVLGILDTGYRIQGYRKTGYRIAYRIQDYIQVPAA